ncbi:bifunctional (p)ppGpp synthetase/guanosine-3',5'-bis(diphosphate) 3'-pyrophosphohydrolase [Ectothiorhodospiraceae bacterium BW-2]|nr:bifunctional (p)ppGpp synthetase/guanosine-3',5'-bis(diphosphate) 3'-pyrophosphohydrolase [Ectothiorhodospiraceae bacterium BW-2]
MMSDLCDLLESYLPKEQVTEVYQAYLFGAEAHEGQRRVSGEPYIYHPLAVARILAELRLDYQTVIAGILHDVIEDTPTARDKLVEDFGEEVAYLVDGVSKLNNIQSHSKLEAQAKNFRKMVLAMVKDVRVIIIKLADRLHNMRTLSVMRPDKRRRIAVETLEIYAPIALRLGINQIRLELETLGFAAYHPRRYEILEQVLRRVCGNRRPLFKKIISAIEERLQQEGLEATVIGRDKHLYSIYRKMRDKHCSFKEVTDLFGVRIIVTNVDACYRALGIIHNLFKPVPGKFKDYIAIPKINGYQSLHTSLQSSYGFPINVQIRTEEMEREAEYGIVSHWLYKSGEQAIHATESRVREWMQKLLEMQQNAGDPQEFLENVKLDLFPDQVYLFTPKGEITVLPRGATVVDFAYSVHTGVGDHCIAARIDGRPAPLHLSLHNGQRVEIITDPKAHPNPSWLQFVATAKARSSIRNYLKNIQRHEAIQLGWRLLDSALKAMHHSLKELEQAQLIEPRLSKWQLNQSEQLFAEIGFGNHLAPLIAKELLQREGESGGSEPAKSELDSELLTPPSADTKSALAIHGTEGSIVTYAKCCRPIPGDPIFGYLTSGRGVVIHTCQCNNLATYQKHPQKWVDVTWDSVAGSLFLTDLRVSVTNKRGVLATVAATISALGINIDNINIDKSDGVTATMNLTLAVHGREELAAVMRRLRRVDNILKISRGS